MSVDADLPDRACAKCGQPVTCWIELPDGRERPVCDDHADDGEVIRDV